MQSDQDKNKQLITKIPDLYTDTLENILCQHLLINLQELQIHLNEHGFTNKPKKNDKFNQYFTIGEDTTANNPDKLIVSPKFFIPSLFKEDVNDIDSFFKFNELSYQPLNKYYLKRYYNIYRFLKGNPDYSFYFWNVTFPNLFHCFIYNKALEDAKNFIFKLYEITEQENLPDLKEFPVIDENKHFPIEVRNQMLKDSVISFVLHNMSFRNSLLQLFFTFLIPKKADDNNEDFQEEEGINIKNLFINKLEALHLAFQSSLTRLAKQQIDALIFLKNKLDIKEFQHLIIEKILIRSVKQWKYSPYFISNQILYDKNDECQLLNDLNCLIHNEKTTSKKIINISDFFDSEFENFLQNPIYSPPNYTNHVFDKKEDLIQSIFTKLDLIIISLLTDNKNKFLSTEFTQKSESQKLILDTGYLLTKAFKYYFYEDRSTFKEKFDKPTLNADNEVLNLLKYFTPLTSSLNSSESIDKMININIIKNCLQNKNDENDNENLIPRFCQCFQKFFNQILSNLLLHLLLENFSHIQKKKNEIASLLQTSAKKGTILVSRFAMYSDFFNDSISNFFSKIQSNNKLSQDQIDEINQIIETLKVNEVRDIIKLYEIPSLLTYILDNSNIFQSNENRLSIIIQAYNNVFKIVEQNLPYQNLTSNNSTTKQFKRQISSFFYYFNIYAHGFLFSFFLDKGKLIVFNKDEESQIQFFTKLAHNEFSQYEVEVDKLLIMKDTAPFVLLSHMINKIYETLFESDKGVTIIINIGEIIMMLPELYLLVKNIQSIPSLKGSYMLLFISNYMELDNWPPMILHQTLLFMKKLIEDIHIDTFNDILSIINQLLEFFFSIDE